MTVRSEIGVQGGDTLETIRGLLKQLFKENIIDELLVPLEVPTADQVKPTFVKKPEQLENANPLAPVMRVNAALLLVQQRDEEHTQKLGAALRPCELRTVIELAKVQRINLDQLFLIGLDCMGTYEPDVYAQIARAHHESPTDELLHWTRQGPVAPYRLRNACQICEHFTPDNAELKIGLIGANVREHLFIETSDELAERLHLTPTHNDGRAKAIERLYSIRHHRREEALSHTAQFLSNIPELIGLIMPCTDCGKCLDVCPFWDADAFTPRSARERHFDWDLNFPNGRNLMMHEHVIGSFAELIALGRRAISCVGCGMCESACPRNAPLTAIHGVLGRKVQAEYHYIPGRDVRDRLPWARM